MNNSQKYYLSQLFLQKIKFPQQTQFKQYQRLITSYIQISNQQIKKPNPKTMLTNSSKERLRLAHEVLDKQLSGSAFNRASNQSLSLGGNKISMGQSLGKEDGFVSFANKENKQFQISKTKNNVQSEISELQRKLYDLQKKMQNIDVSSSNEQDGQDMIMKIINGRKSLSKQKQRESKGRDSLSKRSYGGGRMTMLQNLQENEQKSKIRTISKNSKSSDRKPKPILKQLQNNSSAEEDSQDDAEIYARIAQEKQKINTNVAPIASNLNPKINQKSTIDKLAPKITVNKQPLILNHSQAPTSSLANSIEHKDFSSNPIKNPIKNPIAQSKQKAQKPHKNTNSNQYEIPSKPSNPNPLRESVKSVQSKKSNKSHNKMKNSGTKSIKSIKSTKKLRTSSSKHSLHSHHSKNSLNLSYGNLGNGGLNTAQLKQLQIQNAKDNKRISNLQKQLNHYKRLCLKQQQKIEEYRVMEIQYRKLENNFSKSQQIRKQQKKIIENLKVKN